MIEWVRIQNYRCLRDVTLELGPLTVFVGPNASGKTAVADALASTGVSDRDRWRLKDAPTWTSKLSDRSSPHIHGLPDEPGPRRAKLVLDPAALRQSQPANEVWAMDRHGSQLANFFDTLSRPDQERFVASFTELVPVYADIKARARDGQKRLQFQDRWDPAIWYEPDEVSDGSMLASAFVALVHQRDGADLIVIEDPDRGLHPYLQGQVVELLRKLSRGEVGPKPIQVVCTTHSKAFLDHLAPEEVRFLSRDVRSGETVVERAPVDNPRWADVYDRYQRSLGDLWLTGAVGGVPGIG